MNFKGGTGKTSLACALAMSLDYGVVTNDSYSPLERVLHEKKLLKLEPDDDMPSFPDDIPIIFDLGGHIDQRTIDALDQSDVVLVLVSNDYLDLKVSVECLNEVTGLHKNVVVVANKTEKAQKKNDFNEIKDVIKKYFPKVKVFNIKKSKAFRNMFKNQVSLDEMIQAGGLQKYAYTEVYEQFLKIEKYILK